MSRALDQGAVAAAEARHARLAKPAGSLGRLEPLGAQLAGIARACPPPLPSPVTVAVFAGDHGVVASGVTPWPQEVTGAMVRTIAAGGAAVSAIARQVGADVVVVDVGVAGDVAPHAAVLDRKVRRGTGDLATGPAMTVDEARRAVVVGEAVALDAVADLRRALVDGLTAAGLAPEPSDACWVLVEAPGLRDVLAPRGVAVRDCASFGLPDHVRIAVPDATGLDRLLEALP